jgi:alpha-tubulin suppressor-like RCC1 family protein
VWCWGDNNSARLGNGTTTTSYAAAGPVLASVGGPPFTGAVSLSVGDGHACVRKANDEVWCWGLNSAGQIGNGNKNDQTIPVKVTDATSVAVGRYHSCAVKADGTMVCWGQGNQGRLGNGLGDRDAGDTLDRTSPGPVLTSLGGTPFDGVASAAAGAVTCAVTTAKDAYCWGINLYGQTGTSTGSYVPAPVLDTNGNPLHNVDRVVAQFTRSCAFLADGQLVCWGRNSEGQLGDGTFINRGLATPVKLSCP